MSDKKLSRRTLIKSAAIGAGAATAATGSAFAAPNVITEKKFEWKMVMTWPKVPGSSTTRTNTLLERLLRWRQSS